MIGYIIGRMVSLLLTVFLITPVWSQPTPSEHSHNFKEGEHLEFKLSYGWFTVGRAYANIDSFIHTYSDKDCFKVDVKGTTSGLLGVFTDVNDSWGAYVEHESLKPVHAYKDIQEGKYLRIAKTDYDYDSGIAVVERYNPKKEERKPPKTYEIKSTDWDFLSAYLNLRNYDFEGMQEGDSIRVNAFYEKSFYNLILEYGGLQTFKSKVGKLKAHKLYLIMEANDIFPKERGIVAYVSADPNHLPLRIEAEMFFGKAYCDLVSYRNIKYGPDFD